MNNIQPIGQLATIPDPQPVPVQRQLETELRRYHDLFKSAYDGYLITDTNGLIEEVNLAACQLLNMKAEFLIGKPIVVFIALPERTLFRNNIIKLTKNPQLATVVWDAIFKPRRNASFPVELRVIPITSQQGRLQLYWSIHDTTQQKLLEQALDVERQRLQTVSQSLVETQESERRHLASELHDEIGQLLTGLKLSLEYSNQQELVAETKITDALAILDQLICQVRDMSIQLRQPTLDMLGLETTLRWHFDRYKKQTRINVHFNCNLNQRRFPSQIEITAYRVIQEALTNVARHAQVDEVFVQVDATSDLLRIEIEDCGVGFDYEQTKLNPTHRGLAGMQERIALLGNQLDIYSELGQGTKITVKINLV